MAFKNIRSHFNFSKEQRIGVLFLLLIIISLQLVYFFGDFSIVFKEEAGKQEWLSLQAEFDSIQRKDKSQNNMVYLFNPNFITDYKGYKLGMSVAEIDRLLNFRKENKFVNSAQEFQKVTQISDSLLKKIAPFFKFPDWVNNKKKFKEYDSNSNPVFVKKDKIVVLDINQATQEDLIKVYGIGEVISSRILKQKEIIGGFVSMEQMNDVWGLSPEVIEKLNLHFKIGALPEIKKIDINNASLKELSKFYYFRYPLAKEIVTYRSMNGDFKNIEDLTKVKGFPVDKAKIITLYLDFN